MVERSEQKNLFRLAESVDLSGDKAIVELGTFFGRSTACLMDGAPIIFQDFFYHWSATLIAAVQGLVDAGMIEYVSSQATAMSTRVCGPISHDAIANFDRAMETADVPALIDRSKSAVHHVPVE